MNIKASYGKKLLIILGIAVLFSLLAYPHFVPNNLNILNKKFVIKKHGTRPICGFYHFATVNRPWRGIVHEQMLVAHLSGLIDASSNVYVTGLGTMEEHKTIYDIFENPKFIYEYDNRTHLYEFPALKKVEKFCLNNDDSLVWYGHSIAASHRLDDSSAWRGIMNHFVLKKWQMCYKLLSSTNYTTCGALLTIDSERKAGWNTYYAGNMWWAKCSHINRLTRIEKIDQKDSFLADLYVTSEPDIGHFNCYTENPYQPWMFFVDNITCTVNQPLRKVR